MLSVTARINSFQQPRGGYISSDAFTEDVFFDDLHLNEVEVAYKSVIGSAVDYLMRFMFLEDAKQAFDIPIRGASLIDEVLGNRNEIFIVRHLIK